MTSVVEIDPKVPVKEYLMENAIVTSQLGSLATNAAFHSGRILS